MSLLPGTWQEVLSDTSEQLPQIAQEQEDQEAIKKIGVIIQQEQQHNFWRKLNNITGKKKTRSATTIQAGGQGGAIVEHSTQDKVKQVIFSEIHNKLYTMAGEAPICNNYAALQAVLDGTYVVLQDSNSATRDLFAEIATIRCTVLKDLVIISISPAQWKQYWKIVNEETSSYESGIHFGHYIVGCKLDIISNYHAARFSTVLAHAIQLE
jgi:hypothetical protein